MLFVLENQNFSWLLVDSQPASSVRGGSYPIVGRCLKPERCFLSPSIVQLFFQLTYVYILDPHPRRLLTKIAYRPKVGMKVAKHYWRSWSPFVTLCQCEA